MKKYAQNMDSGFVKYQTHSQGVATPHQPTPVTRTNFIMEDLLVELISHFLIAMEPTTSGPHDKINHGKAMGAINKFLVAKMKGSTLRSRKNASPQLIRDLFQGRNDVASEKRVSKNA